jgi:hypothetical protein
MGSTWYTHRMLAEAWSTLVAVDRYRLGSETRGLGLSESFGVKDAYGDRNRRPLPLIFVPGNRI